MRKEEIITRLAETAEITKKDATKYVNALVDIIKEGIKKEGEVNIHGFAKFTAETRPERECRNPQTGETFMTAPKLVPKCKFMGSFKDYIAE